MPAPLIILNLITHVVVSLFLAERQGFEPWIPEGITDFESAALPLCHASVRLRG